MHRPLGLQLPVQGMQIKETIKQTFSVCTSTLNQVTLLTRIAQCDLKVDPAELGTAPPVPGGTTRPDTICIGPGSNEGKKIIDK